MRMWSGNAANARRWMRWNSASTAASMVGSTASWVPSPVMRKAEPSRRTEIVQRSVTAKSCSARWLI